MEIMGLTEEAMQYIYKHSHFTKYNGSVEPIGCGYSDGIATVQADMYEVKKINDEQTICLFDYHLDNGTVKEIVQEIKNNKIFLCLKIKNRKKFKWEIKDGRNE
jgi:phage-related protein